MFATESGADDAGGAHLISVFRRFANGCVIVVAALAVFIQVGGWWLDWDAARTLVPGAEEMKTEATAAFTAAAVAFWLLRPGSRNRLLVIVGYCCAAVVLSVGIQDLYDYIHAGYYASGPEFGGSAGSPTGDADARGPETGVALITVGLSLGLRRVRIRHWWPFKLIALIPLTFGIYGLLSYMVPESMTYWTGRYTPIALGVAVCVTLLSMALLLVPTEDASRQLLTTTGPAGVNGRRLLAGAIILSVLLGFFSSQGDRINIPLDQRGVIVSTLTMVLLWLLIWSFISALERSVEGRRLAEREAASSRASSLRWEREAQRIIDSAPDAFIGSNTYGRVTRWNRRAEEMFGWTREEALGRPVTELIVPERNHAMVEALLRREDAFMLDTPREFPAVRKDGSEFEIELQLWRLEEDTETSYNAFITDITERKELQRALVTARDEAVEAANAKSQFLATMSHEIRTPMNGVIGLTDLLLETSLNDTQRRYAGGIQTAGAALLSVINGILDFSKLEAGRITIEETTFDPSRLVDEVTDVFANTAQDRGLELIGSCDVAVPHRLRGDPTRLRQILLNLTSNALKFTRQGEVIVRITRDAEALDDEELVPVRFEVTDTGIGIAPEKRDRPFLPFSQADVSTTREYGGTGLGLAICQRLTDAMGGRIGVESSPGAGSTFWCVIPLRRAAEGADISAPPMLHNLRVLIVDDNESNRVVLDGQLRAWGMRPTMADRGEGALKALRAAAGQGAPYDLAIIDLIMPGMDGIELAGHIGADSHIPSPHLVLLTSSGDPNPPGARAAGFAATLTKPVHRSALYERLAEVMSHEKEGGEATATARPGDAGDREAAEREPEPVPPPTRGKVLVVEDNEINQAVAVGFLNRLGYETDVASDGRQALDKIAKATYAAVLMDCQMPVMDGYDATTELRKREGFARHTPVIAMTAGALAENRDRCIAAGMDDFIPKPVSQDAVATVLCRWVPCGRETAGGAAEPARQDTTAAPGTPNGPAPPAPPSAPSVPADGEHVQPACASIRQRMEELRSGDPDADREAFTRIATMFITREGADIEELAAAIERRDADQIRQCAHRIKGAAGNIGATALSKISAEIEDIGRQGRLDGAPELLDRLRFEFDQARGALESILNSPPVR
ncbi:MAG TPA: response regulator [Streptosporangiaceae bacterium]|nr:response regulator [Streptosporangiaceae bacterium]